MSLLKKTAVKAAIVTAFVALAPVTASAMVTTPNIVAERVDLGSKVKDVQRKMRPAGNTIVRPVRKAARWVDNHMSVPALLLIFVFGGVFVLMGSSGASSRTGNYH